MNPIYPKAIGANSGYTVTEGSNDLTMSLQGAARVNASRPTAAHLFGGDPGASVQYTNALPGEDLQYQTLTGGVKEALVLNSVPGPTQTSWTWVVHAPGMTLTKTVAGFVQCH